MTKPQRHIIRQMEVDFSLGTAEKQDYHVLAERLSLLGKDHIPAIIERVLSDLVAPDTYLHYDKIVLDFELEHLDDLENSIRAQLADQIETVLESKRPAASVYRSQEEAVGASSPKTPLGPAQWILYFLYYGYMPWSAPRELTPAALVYELTELLAEKRVFAQQLSQLLLHPHCLKRMLLQFGAPSLMRLIAALAPAADYDYILHQKLEARSKAIQRKPMAEQLQFWAEELRLVASSAFGAAASKARLVSEQTEEQAFPLPVELRTALEGAHSKARYLQAVGLIILHPFLSRFLRLHKAVEDKAVTRPDLAAALLHSLVNGTSPSGEWELVLPKVLLGIPIETPLSLVPLSQEQIASGNELIEAAIGHWSALKNTTVEGFRASFIQREGILTPQGADWYLQVEQAPYDMLLDMLPWNISMIKLPWMTGMLRVEWGQN